MYNIDSRKKLWITKFSFQNICSAMTIALVFGSFKLIIALRCTSLVHWYAIWQCDSIFKQGHLHECNFILLLYSKCDDRNGNYLSITDVYRIHNWYDNCSNKYVNLPFWRVVLSYLISVNTFLLTQWVHYITLRNTWSDCSTVTFCTALIRLILHSALQIKFSIHW